MRNRNVPTRCSEDPGGVRAVLEPWFGKAESNPRPVAPKLRLRADAEAQPTDVGINLEIEINTRERGPHGPPIEIPFGCELRECGDISISHGVGSDILRCSEISALVPETDEQRQRLDGDSDLESSRARCRSSPVAMAGSRRSSVSGDRNEAIAAVQRPIAGAGWRSFKPQWTGDDLKMFRRAWQSGIIALARSPTVKAAMQRIGGASLLASRFVAGTNAEDAVDRATALQVGHSIHGSLFYLGEYVDSAELVAENVAAKLAIAALLGRAGLDIHVSVDPTQIGHNLDPAEARRSAIAIAEAIQQAAGKRPGVHTLMFDMEDHSVIDATISLHEAVVSAGPPAALTLQANLRRTEADICAQIRRGAHLRLVKGAFIAGREIAFTSQPKIKVNSRRIIELILFREARDAGVYPSFATHGDHLQAYALERAAAGGWRSGEYEFEMLLGVRSDVAKNLARRGERVRLYLPFGRDWWPYAVRRIGENPRNAPLLLRSLVGI